MNSVVVIVHNVLPRSEEILGMTTRCLDSLNATADQPYELILMDNGSMDKGVTSRLLDNERMKSSLPGMLIMNKYNLSISACWNNAIQVSQGEIVMLINNDVVFNRKGWMSTLSAPLGFPDVGATGSHLMGWNGFNFLEGSFLAFNKERVMRIAENGKLFDEQFEFTCEEADFCTRLERAGLSLVETAVESGGLATHLHHGTLSWSNEDGGWNGQSILNVMHECRRKLCRKYGRPEQVDD